MQTIAIVGLGLIGGSLGLDFSRLGYRVLGVARRPETVAMALKRGVIHQGSTDLSLVAEADGVFLCTPIDRVIEIAQQVVPHLKAEAILTDVSSVKGALVPGLTALWPHFIGGHPMAGKAEAGLAVAEAHLFRGRPYVLTPTADTVPQDLDAMAGLVDQLEARRYCCSPQEHDQAVAWISHLPVMVSSSLIQACQQEPKPELRQLAQALASSGFYDTSRVGGGVPELGTLMARYNREALLSSIALYQRQLGQIRALVEVEDWDGLHHFLAQTQAARPAYVDDAL
ncbi:arogenate dehydrogenase [Leptolyngbya sp. BL0902]|uniref:prephenate/arogenate dehydrogenase n=1 Tax=Leptolyngbya sp. BL0902 TaxID=1115757 RepID=UPI0018E72561|nr:prephenate/arogenate dehydrogenase [Leptolyngbya sp. BL0902]QQE63874.1 arogenate dehydrogenase [Leptolyngbya sp. BL0902]